MEKPNTRLHDENNGLDYVLVGDYYFPALILAEDSRPVGRWGRMYKRYLKEHHSARYQACHAVSHELMPHEVHIFIVDLVREHPHTAAHSSSTSSTVIFLAGSWKRSK